MKKFLCWCLSVIEVQLFLKAQLILHCLTLYCTPCPLISDKIMCLILYHALKTRIFLFQLVYSGFHVLHICVTLQFVEVHLRHMDTWRFLVPAVPFHAIWQHWCIAAPDSYDNCKQVSPCALRSTLQGRFHPFTGHEGP